MATHSIQNAQIPQIDKDLFIKSFILSQEPFAQYYASQGPIALEIGDSHPPESDKDPPEEQNARGIFSSPVLQPRVASKPEPQRTSPVSKLPSNEDKTVMPECVQKSISNKRTASSLTVDPSATRESKSSTLSRFRHLTFYKAVRREENLDENGERL